MSFFRELRQRSALLSSMGWFYLAAALVLLIVMPFFKVQVLGINALIKPIKFLLSSTIFTWTVAWLMYHLPNEKQVRSYSWVVVGVLSFENIYITWQAFLGQLSHFNISTPFHDIMFGLMGMAIGIMTAYTLFMSFQFFRPLKTSLPPAYLWGIRLGLLLFTIFAFEGYAMGAILAHTVGAPDGGDGLPFNWSTQHGDLRVAHFLGMHALQLLPLAGYYIFKKAPLIIAFALFYFLAVSAVLWQAMQGVSVVGWCVG